MKRTALGIMAAAIAARLGGVARPHSKKRREATPPNPEKRKAVKAARKQRNRK